MRRTRPKVPLIVSVHGGDVLYTAPRSDPCSEAVRRTLKPPPTTVLRQQPGIAELSRPYGAGADVASSTLAPIASPRPRGATVRRRPSPSLVTVGHPVARKRHADVMRALAVLAKRHPSLRYVIIGDGPERVALEGLAARLEVSERVEFRGQLAPAEAIEQARRCTLFAMPSTEEAFGVAYIEAMAGGVPAIGCRGEAGPEEIAAAGDGFMLVPPGDIERLTQRIDELLSDPQRLREAGIRARETVAAQLQLGALRRANRCGLRARASMKPVLFVTGHAPAYRVGAFERLHEPRTSSSRCSAGASSTAADRQPTIFPSRTAMCASTP